MKRVSIVLVLVVAMSSVALAARIPVVGHTSSGESVTLPWSNVYDDSGMSGDTHTLADVQISSRPAWGSCILPVPI